MAEEFEALLSPAKGYVQRRGSGEAAERQRGGKREATKERQRRGNGEAKGMATTKGNAKGVTMLLRAND